MIRDFGLNKIHSEISVHMVATTWLLKRKIGSCMNGWERVHIVAVCSLCPGLMDLE
jgi:hypothetical protein